MLLMTIGRPEIERDKAARRGNRRGGKWSGERLMRKGNRIDRVGTGKPIVILSREQLLCCQLIEVRNKR